MKLKLTALLPMEVLFASNWTRLPELHTAGITKTEELALHSASMLASNEELSLGAIVCIEEIFFARKMQLKAENESLLEAVIRLFGAVEEASIEVLNFTTKDDAVVFQPLPILMAWIYDEYPGILTIGDLENASAVIIVKDSMTDHLFELLTRLDALRST